MLFYIPEYTTALPAQLPVMEAKRDERSSMFMGLKKSSLISLHEALMWREEPASRKESLRIFQFET